ncbi:hypothetical protein EUGRSUZ_B03139 [Eucalyptus grandis]|uniref:Uncharacterized protein n=2 Tax=Eucalyptus grandis TaxID=71139 RepID=A0ACC3LV77_EUCGR|nr:hypothetical protein EUGRSUZ_B03139 [Eucalyptus grandis]
MATSITPYPDADRTISRKSLHRRNDSGELDVFEAARYFSGYNDVVSAYDATTSEQKAAMARDQERQANSRGGRMSLDVPMKHHHHHHQHHQVVAHQHFHLIPSENKQTKEKNKITKPRQPSSPGGRLASFLNSLFSQSSSKKKKSSSKSSSTQSMKDEDESPGWRRRRRSSISHFRSSSAVADSKSVYSTLSSGSKTPPAYVLNTPTKSYKEFRSYSDHKQVAFPKNNRNNEHLKVPNLGNDVVSGNKRSNDLSWLDEKFKLIEPSSEKKKKSFGHNGFEKHASESTAVKRFNEEEEDDGAESDSSSDLFELQNYDLGGYCSSGLPVYETTCIESIKRGSTTATTVSGAAF